MAYLNLQELKLENDVLGQENDELKIQLESLTEYPEATYGKQHKQTHDSKTIGRGIATRDQIETTETNRTRPARAVESLDADASVRKNAVDAQRQNSHNIHTRQQKQTEYDELFSLDLSHLSVQQHTRHTKTRANTTEKKLPNTSKQRTKKPIIEYSEDIELSEGEMGTETRGFRYRNGPANDLTFLSFIDVGFPGSKSQ